MKCRKCGAMLQIEEIHMPYSIKGVIYKYDTCIPKRYSNVG